LVEEDNWGNGDVKCCSYDIVGNMKVGIRMWRMGVCCCGRMKRDLFNGVEGKGNLLDRNVVSGIGRVNGIMYVVEK